MGPLKELSRVQYMPYANVSEGEHHLPHTPGLPVGIVVTRHMPISPALSPSALFSKPGQEHPVVGAFANSDAEQQLVRPEPLPGHLSPPILLQAQQERSAQQAHGYVVMPASHPGSPDS